MRFPMIVYKSDGSGYGGLLPDFPGCYPMGENLDELTADVQGAVETWMEGEDPAIFPVPSALEVVQASEDAKGRALVLVDVNTAFLESVAERVNITVPRYALAAIDRMAKAQGLSRSAYMVRSALASQV
ncbi:MAG: type II toxin-antitoxin system HicB family antitoxin [Deltaproteobacteria bacterium]|jgi:predicted RNase H-like HicB family nuclease|nr:type II toxin-antitoxin system HicB family antitoxin [Deltaproteobacteria bacterium]